AVSVHSLFAPMAAVAPQAGHADQLSRGPAEIASNSSSARPGLNDDKAGRDAETTKRAETGDDFLRRWSASDIDAPPERKAEAEQPAGENQHLTSRPNTNESWAAADRNTEIATAAKSRDDLPSPPGASDIDVPADRKVALALPAEEHHLTSRPD